MRLVLISDTHGLHRDLSLPEGDVLIHAGDFMSSGKSFLEIADFGAWMSSLPFKHRIVIAGNHDMTMQYQPEEARAMLWDATYLQDSECVIDGVKFYGSPWTTKFMNWAFMSERGSEMKAHWDKIPDDTDVLITHGPPHGILDGSQQWGDKFGCEELRTAVFRVRPQLHVFGHIHFGYGEQKVVLKSRSVGVTTATAERMPYFVNAAQVDEGYRLVNKPIVVDL